MKKLREHNWLEIAKKDKNAPQSLQRLEKDVTKAINGLTLIAQRLPQEKQKEMFSYTKVKQLFSAILGKNNPFTNGYTTIDDARQLELAALLVKLGISVCIEQYRSKIEEDSDLNDLTISHLLKARELCNAISFKIRLPQIKEEAEKEGLVYLFNWNKIKEVHESMVSELTGDTRKFANILSDIYHYGEMGPPAQIINTITENDEHEQDSRLYKKFEFTDAYKGGGYGNMWINLGKRTAHLYMYTAPNRPFLKSDFIIKMQNENIHLFEEKEKARERIYNKPRR